MKNHLNSAFAAVALGLLAQAPAHSAVVFTFNDSLLSCPTLSVCAISTDGNLAEGS